MRLPFLKKEDIVLSRAGDELIVHIGNYKRNLLLPRVLARLEVAGARFQGENLLVIFVEDAKDRPE